MVEEELEFDLDEDEDEDDETEIRKVPIWELEEELTKKYHFKCLKDTKELYFYDDSKGV